MRLLRDCDLSTWHSMAAHAQARQLLLIDCKDELQAVDENSFFLGCGCNVIFVGEITRPIVHLQTQGIRCVAQDACSETWDVAAGVAWQDVVDRALAQGLGGVENLTDIPGSVGAAPVQNIGAYGVELADVLESVEVYDLQRREWSERSLAQCALTYRHSVFKQEPHLLITQVRLRLQRQVRLHVDYAGLREAHAQSIGEVAARVRALRQKKLPDPRKLPNCGSFFHNPLLGKNEALSLLRRFPDAPLYAQGEAFKLSAGWCIEQSGWKGRRVGAVGVSEQHALVLVNYGAGSGADILHLAREIQTDVRAKIGVELNIEPTIVQS